MATKTFFATKDASMAKSLSGDFSGWNGKDNHLQVGARLGVQRVRSVLYFNIDFSDMDAISQAVIKIYDGPVSNPNHSVQSSPPTSLKVARMLSDWGEGNENPGEGSFTKNLPWDWDNRFDEFTNANAVTVDITSGTFENEQTIDITQIVIDWFNGAPNYGVILINDSDETSNAKSLLFLAREGGGLQPRIEITYTTNTAPNAPTPNFPVGDVVVNSLSPVFNMTANDPDDNDYITAASVRVYRGDFRYVWDDSTSSNPGSGVIRFSSSSIVPTSTFDMYINETTDDGDDFSDILDLISFGKTITLVRDDSVYVLLLVAGTPTDNGTYRTIPVQVIEVSGDFSGDISVLILPNTSAFQTLRFPEAIESLAMWSFSSIPVEGQPSSVSVTYGQTGISTPLVGNRRYIWIGRTYDKAGVTSTAWSAPQWFIANSTPNIPTLSVSPLPLSSVPTLQPVYSITHTDPDPGDTLMHGYRVLVEKESAAGSGSWTVAWDSGNVDVSGSPATTKAVTSAALDVGSSYRVRAQTRDSLGSWSALNNPVAFSTFAVAPPTNLSPANGETTPVDPSFSGNRGHASNVITSYQIIVYTDDLQTTMWDSGVLSSNISIGGGSFSALYDGSTLSSGQSYRWKARVTTSQGTSDYSTLLRFTVDDPTVPTISSPVGTGISDLTPSIIASRVSSFDAYQIELYPDTATSVNLGTPIWESGTETTNIASAGLGTQFTYAYDGAQALEYNTTYKIRVRVSANAGVDWSSWSGLSAFTTTSAENAILTSVGGVAYPDHPWITDATPDFVVTRGGADTIDDVQVRVYNSSGSTVIWDSGFVNVTNGTTATLTYDGPTLTPATYLWDARYRSAAGPIGGFSNIASFTINSRPNIPSERFPTPGHVFADTLLPLFRATFSDNDVTTLSDTPSEWEIVVEEADDDPVDTITVSSGLMVGPNEYQWTVSDTTLVYGQEYKWRTRYKDSKGEWGDYSSYQSFFLKQAPNGTIAFPSDGSFVNLVTPIVTWSYVGQSDQSKFTISVSRTDDEGNKVADIFSQTVVSASPSFTIPGGYLKDNRHYDITLTVYDSDGVVDPSPSKVNIEVQQNPPDPITGLSPTSFPAMVRLQWDTAIMKTTPVVHKFVAYRIYRRLRGDIEWQHIADVTTRTSPEYDDWFAGNSLLYQYRVATVVTVVGESSAEIESPDDINGGSFAETVIDSDDWMIVGANRSDEYIQTLPVTAESHNRVVQQETFETLGSDRKVILRGFVLGHEGSITCLWTDAVVALPNDPQRFYEEHIIGRRLLHYITNNKGPHILKSPFGDVWEVEFAGPSYQWGSGASLEVSLEWIEVGQTSREGV